MNRADLQTLALVRIDEAQALLALSPPRPSGAYYLAGYAVECALKAAIARLFNQHDWPDKKFVSDCHTHDLGDLIRLAGFEGDLKADRKADKNFDASWQVVKDWTERSRYERHSAAKAKDLVDAVGDPTNGVLRWITARW